MRSIALLFASTLIAGLSQPAAKAAEPIAASSQIDHVLLWGRNIDQVSSVMTVKLGFQVMPGRDPGGVANRYVRMADGSYLELEAITRPHPDMDPGMLADQSSLRGGPGSRTFGLRSPTLDQARLSLQEQGFGPTPIFSASPNDPDGAGPTKPPRWRLFAFEHQPLSSNLFFIDYAPRASTPSRVMDDRVASEHPNGAGDLSAVWLLSGDAAKDREQFKRMGYASASPVRIPQISANGYCVPVGQKRIFVLQPDGNGIAADALRSGGPQVLGVSIGVADLDRAQRRASRGYEKPLVSYHGLLGDSFLAPTQEDLGLLMEFHAISTPQATQPCGDAGESRGRS
jgi:hypothetical protein